MDKFGDRNTYHRHPQGAKEVYHILIYIFNKYKSTSCGFQATCLVREITGGFLYGTSNFISGGKSMNGFDLLVIVIGCFLVADLQGYFKEN